MKLWSNFLISLFFLHCLCGVAVAFMRLYTESAENKHLIGVEGRIYYINNGVPDAHALRYPVHVASNISTLEFWWSANVSYPVRYSLRVSHEPSEALGKWSASIPLTGTVPSKDKNFTVTLPCSWKAYKPAISFDIQISINSGGKNPLNVDIQRLKICTAPGSARITEEPPTNVSYETDEDNLFGSVKTDPASLPDSGNSRLMIAGIVFVLFLVFILVMILIVYNSRGKQRPEIEEEGLHSPPLLMPEPDLRENAYVASPKQSVIESVQYYDETTSRQSVVPPNSMFVPSMGHGKDIRSFDDALRELDVDPRYVQVGAVVAAGTFGMICRGLLLTENESREILIKTVGPGTVRAQSDMMRMEGIMMYAILHPNVSELIGVVNRVEQPMVLFADSQRENLKSFLGTKKVQQLGVHALVRMSVDILAGLEFLHRKNHIHKDIAARNCLISPDLEVQIADNALARDLFPNDYQCLGDNENRPVKWLAYESLVFGQFHPPSDVLMTLGQNPYFEIDGFEVGTFLQKGYRLLHPENCPDAL